MEAGLTNRCGQVKLRRIDGWRKIAGMLSQRAGMAA